MYLIKFKYMDKKTVKEELYAAMKHDYEQGLLSNPTFEPFFAWKFYGSSKTILTKSVCNHILNETQEELMMLDEKHPMGHRRLFCVTHPFDVFRPYRGYYKDCYTYAYLVQIEREMLEILLTKK